MIIQAVASGRLYDPRDRLPSLPAAVAEVVMRAMAADPADRFATARQMREALTRCLDALGASNREHDVTASLAALMETPEPAPILLAPVEAVPEAIEIAADPSSGVSSGADVALCEVEIIEASGPIQMSGARTENGFAERPEGPPPLPAIPSRARANIAPPSSPPPQSRRADPSAPHWSPPGQLFERVFGGPSGTAPGLLGWRRTPEQPPHDSHRSPLQRAVELFDRGIALRVAGRYGEALEAWERAAALAPENRVYRVERRQAARAARRAPPRPAPPRRLEPRPRGVRRTAD